MTDLGSLFGQNTPYVQPGAAGFTTALAPQDEMRFRSWVLQNKVPFNAEAAGPQDYDMRGYWSASQNPAIWKMMQGLGVLPPDLAPAGTKIDPNDGRPHYPDYWKTPLHETFSGESKFATPVAPMWNARDQLVSPGGRILFDDRRPSPTGLAAFFR